MVIKLGSECRTDYVLNSIFVQHTYNEIRTIKQFCFIDKSYVV